MAALFGIGSLCFALGSMPLYFDRVSASVVAATFFTGSIFFTSAAYLQYHETLMAPVGVMLDSPRPTRLASLVGWAPRRLDWWAAVVQLVGTVFFNVSTFAAARYLRTSGDIANVTIVNLGTFLGALCFLAGAVLLPVESAGSAAPTG